MRKVSKRLPLPKKPPKVEAPKNKYDRKRAKKELKQLVNLAGRKI